MPCLRNTACKESENCLSTVDGRITYIEPAYKFLRITDSSGHTDIRFIDIWDISVETHSDENQAEHTEYE